MKIRLVAPPSITAFEHALYRGRYDFAYMNPYHQVRAKQLQGFVPLVRDGNRRLKGILVVRRDGKIKSVDQLRGKQIAFPAPNAFGASLFMRALLAQQGIPNNLPCCDDLCS